jgi:hypothetical protein
MKMYDASNIKTIFSYRDDQNTSNVYPVVFSLKSGECVDLRGESKPTFMISWDAFNKVRSPDAVRLR